MAFEPFFHFMRGIQGKLIMVDLEMDIWESKRSANRLLRSLQKEMKQSDALYVPLHQLKVVVFDIETTGFFPEQGDEIISIGAIKVCGEEIQEDQQFYSLIRYEKELSSEIMNLTGITNDQLKMLHLFQRFLFNFLTLLKMIHLLPIMQITKRVSCKMRAGKYFVHPLIIESLTLRFFIELLNQI